LTYVPDNRVSGKKPIHVFLLIVTVLAALGYTAAFAMGDDNRTGGILIVQFAPLVAAFLTKLIFQRNLRGLGWAWGKTRYHLVAHGLAFLLPLISFSLIWSLGFGGFYDEVFITKTQTGIAHTFGIDIRSPFVLMLALILLNGTLGMFVAFGGIGEEMGWRGFLVPELYRHYNFTKTALISGAIWAVFHWPLLILLLAPRLGVSPWAMLPISLVAGIGLSTIMAWFRLKSGSVWTAVIFHMGLNIHTQGFFQNLTIETSWLTNYVSGEHGLMLALVSLLFGYWFWQKRGELPGNGQEVAQG